MSLSGEVHAIIVRLRATAEGEDYGADDVADLIETADKLADLFDD